MYALKRIVLTVGFLLLIRYVPPVYYANEFNGFVKSEPQRTKGGAELRSRLIQRAEWYVLPIKSADIRINSDGDLIRVNVDYKVPVNLFVFTHTLNFHATGVGVAVRD